jgi:hypothetical protein
MVFCDGVFVLVCVCDGVCSSAPCFMSSRKFRKRLCVSVGPPGLVELVGFLGLLGFIRVIRVMRVMRVINKVITLRLGVKLHAEEGLIRVN